VTTKLDTSDWKAGVEGLRRKFPAAVRRALKRAGTSGRAEMTKQIAKDTGLPSRRIRTDIRITTVGDTALRLEVTGKRIPLVAFKARGPEPSRGRGRGVSYRNPQSPNTRAPHAFIATMRSGHRGVFERKRGSRTPIRELFGPSLVRVFEKFLPAGARRAQEALKKNLKSEIAFALSRR
jgi:hypothetical protein